MEKETLEKGDGVTVYEASYLLLPSLAEAQVPLEVASIKEAVTSRGGEVISSEDPILIDLAYQMTKVTPTSRVKTQRGYFGWVKFELPAGEIENIKKYLENNANIIRNLVIKTVRENTLLTGKMNIQREEREKRGEDEAVDPEVEVKETPTEEVDKSIDDLVIA
ncbi:MAG TPA: 30S ribosomal protein S6 [Candidatus Paceibacterota bacterium]